MDFCSILGPTCLHFPSQNPPKSLQKPILKGIDFLIDFDIDFKTAQESPKTAQDAPRRRSKRQDGPKRPPRRPQDGPKRPQKFGCRSHFFDLGRRGPPRAPRDPSKTDFWSIFGRCLVDFRWFLRCFLVDFSSRTPSYLDLVFISIFDPMLFHFGIDHGAFDDHVLLLISRLFCYFSVGPTICYRAVRFLG